MLLAVALAVAALRPTAHGLHGAAALRPHPPLAMCAPPSEPRKASISAPALLSQPTISISVGVVLLLALVTNRLLTEELLNSQSRTDLIAVVASIVLALNGLSSLDITPREADTVPLTGARIEWALPALPAAARAEVEWTASALCACTPCTSVALWRAGRTLCLRGVLAAKLAPFASGGDAAAGLEQAVQPGPLLSKSAGRASGAPEYLPALQLLPGRTEFSYLPEETQAVLILPLGGEEQGALVLGADRARAFGKDDVTWARALAKRLGRTLAAAED